MTEITDEFMPAEVFLAIACRSEKSCIKLAYRDKDAPKDCPTSKNSFWMKARSKGEKDGTDLFEYFNPVLDELEADSRRIREMARPRI